MCSALLRAQGVAEGKLQLGPRLAEHLFAPLLRCEPKCSAVIPNSSQHSTAMQLRARLCQRKA